jgi:hypothetical protein
MAVKYDAVVATGTYTDKNGKEKTQWTTVGNVIDKDGKLSLKLNVVPVAFNGWINFFEPKNKDQKQQKFEEVSDDFPF